MLLFSEYSFFSFRVKIGNPVAVIAIGVYP
jgi:hypothetical protein